MTDENLTMQIAQALVRAAELDRAAREQRRRAGHLLAQAQEAGGAWLAGTGLDRRSALLLIEIAVGAKPAVHS